VQAGLDGDGVAEHARGGRRNFVGGLGPVGKGVGSGGGDVEVDAGFAARSMTALPLAERAAGRSRGSAAAASANEPSLADRRPRTGCWRPGEVVGSASGPVRGQPPHAEQHTKSPATVTAHGHHAVSAARTSPGAVR